MDHIQLIINMLQLLQDRKFGVQNLGILQPILIQYMQQTDLRLTADNDVVIGIWGMLLAISSALLFLLILFGVIHTMVSHSTGSLAIPVSQFLPKIIVTALAMNLSYFFGRTLLQINNLLCGEININLDTFFKTLNKGSSLTPAQALILTVSLFVFLNIGIIRILFQQFERLVLWNFLLILAPLAVLFSFLPQTSTAFTYWARMFFVVTFTQFFQFLVFALAVAMLARGVVNGLAGYIMAIAMILFVGRVPDLFSRFPGMAIANFRGIGPLISTTLVAARLLIA